MIFGYARVSTKGQAKDGNSLEAQQAALKAASCERIFVEAYSGANSRRPELAALMNTLQRGDTVVVTKLDRIARSLESGLHLIETLNEKGVSVNVLNMGMLDDTPTGKLIRNVMLCFAEFERNMILERTREGKEVAKKNPDYRDGRPKKYSEKKVLHALDLLETHSYSQVVEMTGISKATLYRARREQREKG
ncbi:MAG: recombinase family protein [Lachnospiraceae bacterium]|nr:recombinase family protein [Lachnospiraceae bacterium]